MWATHRRCPRFWLKHACPVSASQAPSIQCLGAASLALSGCESRRPLSSLSPSHNRDAARRRSATSCSPVTRLHLLLLRVFIVLPHPAGQSGYPPFEPRHDPRSPHFCSLRSNPHIQQRVRARVPAWTGPLTGRGAFPPASFFVCRDPPDCNAQPVRALRSQRQPIEQQKGLGLDRWPCSRAGAYLVRAIGSSSLAAHPAQIQGRGLPRSQIVSRSDESAKPSDHGLKELPADLPPPASSRVPVGALNASS